ncbi:MAG: helix-turn-helix domain-containing protein [Steroidobacterales bacterium]
MNNRPKTVPSYALYGEQRSDVAGERLHIEDIQARSRKYSWEITAHTHRGLCQCVFVAAGPVAANVDDVHAELRGPAFAIVPPGAVHAFRFSESTTGYVLTVAPQSLFDGNDEASQASFRALFAVPHVLALDSGAADADVAAELAGRLQRLFERLLEEFRQPGGAGSPVCVWLGRSVLWLIGHELLRRHQLGDAHRHHGYFARFQSLLEKHYREHWPVSRYAHSTGMTEGRLNRLCRVHGGRSAFELLQERLALEARRRLTYVAMPVAQVATELGFADPAYFCRFFKRRAGISPRQFRRRLQSPAD